MLTGENVKYSASLMSSKDCLAHSFLLVLSQALSRCLHIHSAQLKPEGRLIYNSVELFLSSHSLSSLPPWAALHSASSSLLQALCTVNSGHNVSLGSCFISKLRGTASLHQGSPTCGDITSLNCPCPGEGWSGQQCGSCPGGPGVTSCTDAQSSSHREVLTLGHKTICGQWADGTQGF